MECAVARLEKDMVLAKEVDVPYFNRESADSLVIQEIEADFAFIFNADTLEIIGSVESIVISAKVFWLAIVIPEEFGTSSFAIKPK